MLTETWANPGRRPQKAPTGFWVCVWRCKRLGDREESGVRGVPGGGVDFRRMIGQNWPRDPSRSMGFVIQWRFRQKISTVRQFWNHFKAMSWHCRAPDFMLKSGKNGAGPGRAGRFPAELGPETPQDRRVRLTMLVAPKSIPVDQFSRHFVMIFGHPQTPDFMRKSGQHGFASHRPSTQQ